LVGCSVDPGKNPDMVEVQGKVTVNSKPLTGVTVNFQPTGVGTQATMPVKDGSFKGSITPGKYTYYVTEGSNTASYKSVPSKYREGSLDRQIDIGAGQTLDLKLD
jgi:hypothetical protein